MAEYQLLTFTNNFDTGNVSEIRGTYQGTCWLSTAGGAIYAFVGPALAVIVINTILLGIVLREIRRIIDRDITKIEVSKAKTTAKTLLVFIPIMGAPWVFGVLAINGDTLVFDYLFTALTSFQVSNQKELFAPRFPRDGKLIHSQTAEGALILQAAVPPQQP
ncbi:adhesion G-protein coupled receptor D1-like [Lytechinus variegatus]|uniref:adhesion G-protein coupled receptor D1-like n=1 Tax=Lytechinus variegatus TaxID=7654 RepID=UPI001BB25963|nr:adhesion G-protein coupled receptor D1-like [Lytechinus variegatus]